MLQPTATKYTVEQSHNAIEHSWQINRVCLQKVKKKSGDITPSIKVGDEAITMHTIIRLSTTEFLWQCAYIINLIQSYSGQNLEIITLLKVDKTNKTNKTKSGEN